MSQQSIAHTLGVSLRTVNRDVAYLRRLRHADVALGQSLAKLQVNDGPSSGEALVARVRAEMASDGLEPDGKEVELLRLAADLEDRRADLECRIAVDGVTRTAKDGRVLINPCVAEARQTAAALARVLSGVQMERSVKDPVKQRAAASRWRAHNLAKMRYDGADGGA